MMRIYKKLCDTNHLYYDGREQLGRFLKVAEEPGMKCRELV